MTNKEVEFMSFAEVCAHLGIPADIWHFAKAYRAGKVTEVVWVQKYLVANMVLAVSIAELQESLTELLKAVKGNEADG